MNTPCTTCEYFIPGPKSLVHSPKYLNSLIAQFRLNQNIKYEWFCYLHYKNTSTNIYKTKYKDLTRGNCLAHKPITKTE